MNTYNYKAVITQSDATEKIVYGQIEAKDVFAAEWDVKANEYKANPGAYWVRVTIYF